MGPKDKSQYRILVVDDHEDNIELLRARLEARGYIVEGAGDGQAALDAVDRQCPDLILISERMPVLDGVEAARRIRRQNKECVFPIVAMSTYPTKEAQGAALAAGCDSFVAEPIDFVLLSNLLGRLLPGAAGRQSRGSS